MSEVASVEALHRRTRGGDVLDLLPEMLLAARAAGTTAGESADDSKYLRVPQAVRLRFERLQRAALALLALLVLAMLTGDGLLLRYGDGSGRVGTRRPAAGSVGGASVDSAPAAGDTAAPGGRPGLVRGVRVGVALPSLPAAGIDDVLRANAAEKAQVQQANAAEAAALAAVAAAQGAQEAAKAAAQAAAQAAEQAHAVAENDLQFEARRVAAEARDAERQAAAKIAAAADERARLQTAEWGAGAEPTECAGYFGNGYREVFTLLRPTSDAGGGSAGATAAPALVECRRHPAVDAALCDVRGVIMHADRLRMTRGGESLSAVMGRTEEEELPKLAAGAFEVVRRGYANVPVRPGMSLLEGGGSAGAGDAAGALRDGLGALGLHLNKSDRHKAEFLRTLAVVEDAAASPRVCSQRVTLPVLMVTRMEYANLFHSTTDWYNVWSAARVLGLEPTLDFVAEGLTPSSLVTPHTKSPKIPAHVLFLDGHNAGPMDEGWLGLFVSVSYAKHFEGPVCFDRLIYAPFGYVSAISSGIAPKQTQCRSERHVRQFSDDMVRGLGMLPRAASTCGDAAATAVVFVQRTHYLAHPRHNGKIVRRLDNEDEIMQSLTASTSGGDAGVRLLKGVFSEMSMVEQVRAAQDACVMVGAHGAGLSHVLFSPPGVHMLELQPPAFQRPHFVAYSSWSGAHHHVWALESSAPSVHKVVARVLETAQHASVEARKAEGEHAEHALHGG